VISPTREVSVCISAMRPEISEAAVRDSDGFGDVADLVARAAVQLRHDRDDRDGQVAVRDAVERRRQVRLEAAADSNCAYESSCR
jgi:hypothetical protein